ncbi:MAG: hypothetical protein Q4C66_04200 [Lachnospiraceae bacterium]|nr:hypothetical protein [Lachnospiraceae bacterium]
MQENALSYDTVVNYFGTETIQERFKYLYDKMQEYINERSQQGKLVVNEDILQQLVMDYFTDVYRLKEFHKIEHINITKIVAYEVFWILRRKPLQIQSESSDSKLVFANEGFATTFIAHELLVPEETEPLSSDKEAEFLKFLQHINYHLKYRNVDKQCLEVMLYSFEVGKFIS